MKTNKIKFKFNKDDIVKIHKKFESFPKAYGLIPWKCRSKCLPYFAYGNKPNITATYCVIGNKEWTNSMIHHNVVTIQNVDTKQVYVITENSLYLKYSTRKGV